MGDFKSVGITGAVPGSMWGKHLWHFPMIGKTYYMKYEILIKIFKTPRVSTLQLNPSFITTYFQKDLVYYSVPILGGMLFQ